MPWTTFPLYGGDGRILDNTIPAQDIMVWIGQGAITERTIERLGVSDVGIIMFRRLLEEQIQAVAEGRDPLCVIRDPQQNKCIVLPQEGARYPTEEQYLTAHSWDNTGLAEVESRSRKFY